MPSLDRWKSLVVWITLLWIAGVIAGYFVFHKPITPGLAESLVRIGWEILVCGLILSSAGGLGHRILPNLPVEPLTALSMQAAMGLGLLGLAMLGAGHLGGYSFAVLLPASIILSVLLLKDLLQWWRQWGSFGVLVKSTSGLGRVTAGLIILIFGLGLVTALAPTFRYDALVYHLALPRQYVLAHRFTYVYELMFWGMPQIAEMDYTWAMVLGGSSSAVLLGWAAGLLATMGLMGMLVKELGTESSWVGIAALLAGFTLASGLSWGYVDWWTVLFGTGFLACLMIWKDSGQNAHLGLAGIFAGLSLGVKYTAGVLLICGIWVILLRFRSKPGELLRSMMWFCLPAALVFAPWLLKNWLATGNPVYPLFIPAGEMTALRIGLYQGGQPWGSWMDVLFLPLRATVWGAEGAPGYSASIGPLLLTLGLVSVIYWRSFHDPQRKAVGLALQIALAGLVVWIAAGRFSGFLLQSRLYLALFPAFVFLAAAGYLAISRVVQHGVRFGFITFVLVNLVLGLTAIEVGVDGIKTTAFRQILGLSSSEEYLGENLGWFAPAVLSIRDLPPGSKVMMLWEPRSYYCLPVCVPDEVLDRWLRARYETSLEEPASAIEILNQWKGDGFTHLLIHKSGAEFVRLEDRNYRPDDWSVLEDLLGKIEQIQNFGGAYALYRLNP